MVLDQALLNPEVIVPIIGFISIFGLPLGIYWIKRHYGALEKGMAQGRLPDAAMQHRLEQLERQNAQLTERVRMLEGGEGAARIAAVERSSLPPRR